MINKEDIEKLYKQTSKELYKYIYSILLDEEAAYDVLHNVFLKLISWGKNHNLDGSKNVRSLLYKIAKNESINYMRQNTKIVVDKEDENVVYRLNPIDKIIFEEQHTIAKKILNELSVELRDIFILYYVEGKKQEEIAKLFGVSTRTVRRKLKKAGESIEKALKKYKML